MNPHPDIANFSIEQCAVDFQQLMKKLQRLKLDFDKPLSSARYEVLNYLHRGGAQSLSSISDYRNVTNATMSKIVASLIDEGLVIKASSKLDKRSKLFFISRKANDLLQQQDLSELIAIKNLILKLSAEEQQSLGHSFPILNQLFLSFKKV